MKTSTKATSLAGLAAILIAIAATTNGCSVTTHPETPALSLSSSSSSSPSSLEAVVDQPGPMAVETVIGADWEVPLSGMVNLDHPKAKAAKLTDHKEPIQVAFHVIQHPKAGAFMIDTGVEHALFDAPNEAAIRGIVRSVADVDKMKRRTDTKSWIAAHPETKIRGVFLTHLHVDHISGMRDVPGGTPVFVGPGEARSRSFENLFVSSTTDRALQGKPALNVWRFQSDPDQNFEGILDVFGDASFFAIHVPGHTPGSTAFIARTPNGPILFTGDACHTKWGWENGVEPGSFSSDKKRSAVSLERLKTFAARHPSLEVRVGHQLELKETSTATAQR